MAFLCSLLKWMIVVAILIAFPWTIPIAAAYLMGKSGLFKKTATILRGLWKRCRILDRINDWGACRCKSLSKESFVLDYYLPTSKSPYIIVVNGGGFLCVSSISISDRSRSPEVYSRTVSRTLEVLRGSSRTVAFVGVVTGKGEFYNCLRIASRHGLLTRSELERAGFEQMELLRIASAVVGATSPTAEIRIHRGKEIIERETVAR